MDPRLTASTGYEYLTTNRGDILSGSENQWETLIRENQRLTRRVAILENTGNTRENFDGLTKEIDRLNDAKIQELMKNSKKNVDVEGFEAKRKELEQKSTKMKGHIKSLEKKLKASNDFRFEITEEMEALLEENVNPNQTMCIKMARKTSEYHKELWRKVKFNFEHMRRANSGLQQSLEELDQNVLNLTNKVMKLETSLKENPVKIVGDTMVIQEQQRHIQRLGNFKFLTYFSINFGILEQQTNLENIKPGILDLAVKMDGNAGLIKKDMENRLDVQDQKVKKLENSTKLLMQEVYCLRFNYKESSEEVQKLRSKTSELEKMLSDAVEEEEKTHLAKMAKWREVGIRSLKRKREE
ncbi:hypothetical protein B9Z55_007300 [Caenorhabditis nigoni]|uniref:Uncharacterized protein n=1 Tax=Caenorhabditis nigoni TaxID=1611254 RepID=A0A2G5V9Q3_9PELO|nr:hypothetical protein B9Z55_007300 [Caenorhabditis nigoni]